MADSSKRRIPPTGVGSQRRLQALAARSWSAEATAALTGRACHPAGAAGAAGEISGP
jgi:hypothetical protein